MWQGWVAGFEHRVRATYTGGMCRAYIVTEMNESCKS